MAVTQEDMDKLYAETVAKRKAIAGTTATREADLKSQLSNTLSSRSTLSDAAKSALSNKQLQSLVDNTTNQRLTSSLSPEQLSGQQAISPDGMTSQYKPKTQELTSALSSQVNIPKTTVTNQQAPTTQGLYGFVASNISQGFNEQSKALLQALKQRIAESQQSQKDLIAKAPQQYNPLRAQSEVQKAQELRSVLEQSANMGDRGGVGRQQALLTQTEGANRLNAIDLQQQNFVDQANSEIARLQNEGRYQEAEILANSKAEELRALLQEQVRQEGLASSKLQQQKDDFQYQIVANQNNLQGFANELMAQGAPQWQIDQVLAARQQKIASLGLDQQGNVIPTQDELALTANQAMDLWAITGKATPEISEALGVPIDSVYSTFASRQPKTGTTTTKKNPVDTPQEYAKFNELNNFLLQGRATGQQGIAYLAANYDTLSAKYGSNVVDAMAEKINQDMIESGEISKEQAAALKKKQEEESKTQPEAQAEEELQAAYSEMMASSDPRAWLEAEKKFMTLAEYERLKRLLD